ncbi:SDR family oxidoreductase [Rhodobium gokarnense]|uniref:NAD(P)-dependent dehydrogenase (Short-subunit alcohol dehydrogenase family) n=1 Tax=Rhodobium gokarnense TaxID=364296 RepID=A0ABT3HAZ1_9HYPH|nr:SDR family oxidoreductase [Rhodobium gokarnense]MCW2307550.1 NAD(P)-dependent dehydrogenase (short-subunit alcohol dehydrogenase family) [Rhodobium gokarnense]
MDRFKGKRVLITGATSGIGLAGALRIAAEGAEVIATGRDEARLEALRRKLPQSATVLRNDAAWPEEADILASRVAAAGGLDGLWLNAGFARVGAIDEVSYETFDRIIGANLKGPLLQMAALTGHLRDGASVVLTSSTSAYEGLPVASLYAAAKGAMISVARCWASALGHRNIRVNTLVPGPIDTNFRDFMEPDVRNAFEAAVTASLALPRVGTAEEAAAVAAFLLSDEASFVTGSQYCVDGGQVMH